MTAPRPDGAVAYVIDASPLQEAQYTGIPNVAYEVTKRFVDAADRELHVVAMGRHVHEDLLRQCLDERSGQAMKAALPKLPRYSTLIKQLRQRKDLCGTVGLYLNTKPPERVFDREAMVFYDFSTLLVPECHTESTIIHHNWQLVEQVASCDHAFAISEATARDLDWIFNIPAERVSVALLGAGSSTAAADAVREIIKARKVEPYLLILGTIEPRKNIGLVLKWLSNRREVLETFRVVFAGRQGWGDSFGRQVETHGLEDAVVSGRIVYMSYVDERRKNLLLGGASALVFPSLFEGFGLPVLEAMEIGLPVLSTVSSSLPEVLGDEGYYFDPYKVASLDASFERFRKDWQEGCLEPMIERARYRAKKFSYDKTYQVISGRLDKFGAELISSVKSRKGLLR